MRENTIPDIVADLLAIANPLEEMGLVDAANILTARTCPFPITVAPSHHGKKNAREIRPTEAALKATNTAMTARSLM
jgi:hypothetical protein